MKSAAVTPTSILLLRELSGAERPFELAEINRLRRSPALSAFLPQLPDRREVRGECRHLRLDCGDFLFIPGAAARFFGLFQRFGCLGFVEVVAADRGVSEHGEYFGVDPASTPPATKINSSAPPPAGWMRTVPGLMRVMRGVWRG